MQILNFEQGTDEWHQARAGRVTGSRFADVMAKGKGSAPSKVRQSYAAELVAERLSGKAKPESFKTASMRRGSELESDARLAYMVRTGQCVDQVGFIVLDDDKLKVGVSPDGLVGFDGSIEIKCPESHTHLSYLTSNKLPDEYFWQVHGLMWVSGCEWCDFVSYHPDFPEPINLHIVRVFRDESEIEKLKSSLVDFEELVITDIEKLRKKYGIGQ